MKEGEERQAIHIEVGFWMNKIKIWEAFREEVRRV